jgi:hypothetical protein
MQPPEDALFAHPRLFRACVPPGMHRFRGNIWDFDNRPKVMNILGYPLPMNDKIPEITEARNIELGLGLQVFGHHYSLLSLWSSFLMILVSLHAKHVCRYIIFLSCQIMFPSCPVTQTVDIFLCFSSSIISCT